MKMYLRRLSNHKREYIKGESIASFLPLLQKAQKEEE